MKSNKKNDKKESATQQLLNLKQFVPLQIGDNGAVAIEGETVCCTPTLCCGRTTSLFLVAVRYLQKSATFKIFFSDVAELQMLCMSSGAKLRG